MAPAECWSDEARFVALSALLAEHRHLWVPRPFVDDVGWTADHGELTAWLSSLDDEAIYTIEQAPLEADAPEPYGALARQIDRLTQTPVLPGEPSDALAGARLGRRIRGRKWSQVRAFASAVAPLLPPGELVDWCSGMGHLGRALSLSTGRRASCIERDAALCGAGAAWARGADVAFQQADVLAPDTWEALRPGRSAVALHACGQLGDTLLREGDALDAIAFAPCCYHRQPPGRHRPLSRLGTTHDLGVSVRSLRLATAEEVHASRAQRTLRHQEMAWRLGLAALVSRATGRDGHTSISSLPRSEVRVSFAEFVARAAQRHGLPLPDQWDLHAAEVEGWRRARRARALGLVRGLFRPALELTLFLDRVALLRERGWTVTWGRFCDRELSARNLLMVGVAA